MIKDLPSEIALWEMHSCAKMVPFCFVFKVSGGSLPGSSLKLFQCFLYPVFLLFGLNILLSDEGQEGVFLVLCGKLMN